MMVTKLGWPARNSAERPCTAKASSGMSRSGLDIAVEEPAGRRMIDQLHARRSLDDAMPRNRIEPGGLGVEDDLAHGRHFAAAWGRPQAARGLKKLLEERAPPFDGLRVRWHFSCHQPDDAIRDLPHAEERPKGASRSTHGQVAAIVASALIRATMPARERRRVNGAQPSPVGTTKSARRRFSLSGVCCARMARNRVSVMPGRAITRRRVPGKRAP